MAAAPDVVEVRAAVPVAVVARAEARADAVVGRAVRAAAIVAAAAVARRAISRRA